MEGVAAADLVDRDIGMFVMIEKLRPRKAADKYKQYLAVMAEYGFTIRELHDKDTLESFGDLWTTYRVCGLTKEGLSCMFIAGKGCPIEKEKQAVMLGFLYWMAVHSHLPSLRGGITFVIDQSSDAKPIGNERKLQKVWSTLPLRPRDLFIVNATLVKRIFINSLLAFARLFTSNKVLSRIRFVTMAQVVEAVTKDSVPECYGGKARQPPKEWATQRLIESASWF